MTSVTGNVNGIRKLIADKTIEPNRFNDVDALYQEVRTTWFELVSRMRTNKRQQEAKKLGKAIRAPVGRPLNAELLKRFNDIASRFNIPGIADGRSLVDFLKLYPPSRAGASVDDVAKKQLQRRDSGFDFEAKLAKDLRLLPQNAWVGRSAGSYGAADVIVMSKTGVTLIQCKKADAMRKSLTEHKKLKALYDQVHKIATIKIYYEKNGLTKYVTLDEASLKVLSGESASWTEVNASAVEEVKRSPAEKAKMLEALSTRLHWRGTIKDLEAAYNAASPVIKRLIECGTQWSAEIRLQYRAALDPFRGFLASQDAHFTKALLTPQFAPFVVPTDEAHSDRNPALEGRIFNIAGLAIRVEKEPGVRTLVHVVRLTTNKSKFVAYMCRKDGHLTSTEVEEVTQLVAKLPHQVEFRIAYYANKRLVKTKTIKTRKDAEFFLTKRGV